MERHKHGRNMHTEGHIHRVTTKKRNIHTEATPHGGDIHMEGDLHTEGTYI